MSETGRTDGIASLEAAREQLEAALSSHPQWQALRANADDASREHSARELEGNPLYRSWRLVNEAIGNLRSVHGDSGQADLAPNQTVEAEDAGGPPAISTADSLPVGSGGFDIEHVEQPSASEPADDLTRIRGVDAGTARALAALGVTRYAQIAAWRRADVRDVAEALGLTREISRQNWIEQAALLEHRGRDAGAEGASPVPATPPPSAPDAHSGKADPERARDIDLPDILEAIRKDASEHGETALTEENIPEGSDEPEPDSARTEAATAPSVEHAEMPAAVDDDTSQQPAGEAPAAPDPTLDETLPAEDAAADPVPANQRRSSIPTVSASAHVNTEAAERARRLEAERQRLRRRAEQAELQAVDDSGEATVSFVIREPARPLGSGLPEPVPAHARDSSPDAYRQTAYVQPERLPEEAEVVVVGSSGSPEDAQTESQPATGSVRRFLRSLRRG